MPNGRAIRLTDHELPMTDEREHNRSTFGSPGWKEIVLDSVMKPEKIDELIADALTTDEETEED